MTRIGDHSPQLEHLLDRRLLAGADQQGNADGIASKQELQELAETLEATPSFDVDVDTRRQRTQELLGASSETFATLSPELRAMPAPLRRLALEIDSLWGDADGEISVAEFDRVVEYTLAALPFFTEEAEGLLELAEYLGFDCAGSTGAAPVHKLQMALAHVDEKEVEEARPFRQLFDEALAEGELPGAPEYLRDSLKHSPRWHSFSILEHTNHAVQAVRDLSQTVGIHWENAGATMLLHDVGKILERHSKNPDGQGNPMFHYFDHERVGEEWLSERGLSPDIAFHIRNHMVLRQKSVDEILDIADHDPKLLSEMIVVFMADHVAKGNKKDLMKSFEELRPTILTLSQHAGIDGQALLHRAAELRAEITR